MPIHVPIAESRVSDEPGVVLVAHSLGSCIGVAMYDPVVRAGGVIHLQLPESSLDALRGASKPAMFVDTGLGHILAELAALGVREKRLEITIAGGAQILDPSGVFCIGKRNYAATRRFLWRRGLFVSRECVGGMSPRTLTLDIGNGQAHIRITRERMSEEGARR